MIKLENKKENNKFSLFILLIGGGVMFIDSVLARIGGLVVILLGLITIYAKNGMMLDFEKKQYRKYMRLAWIYMGNWMALPEIKYVAIIRMRVSELKFSASTAGFSQDESGYQHIYHINLIFDNSVQRYLTIYSGELGDAMGHAKEIALLIESELYDCSTSQKKWISLEELKG